MQSLFELLQVKDEKNILIQGLPSSIEKQFAKLSYSKSLTPLLKARKVDFALVFAISQSQLCNILKDIFSSLHPESKLWVAFPKSTSKIASDLNRDCTWQFLTDNKFEAHTRVDLDHVWAAMQFRHNADLIAADCGCEEAEAETEAQDSFNEEMVAPPAELVSLFVKHKKAKEAYSNLAPSHQREYVSWIESAKKADTRKRRSEAALEKLLAGKNTPAEK
jgi:hypothetical protein